MENNVGWTDSLAYSPEEECKTLCSLLVLWMTCTNQEDVSAVQFHFAWHESHAQGFHLRPISAWKRARVLRFLSHYHRLRAKRQEKCICFRHLWVSGTGGHCVSFSSFKTYFEWKPASNGGRCFCQHYSRM